MPALLAAVAYVDPGNFGVNITAGSEHGYALVWVVVFASLSAMLIQYLAAKLGVATNQSLAEVSAERFPGIGRWLLWAQAQVVVVMTDLAEVVGGALALHMLFDVPMLLGALLVTVFSLVVLTLRVRGRSGFESVALALLFVIIGSIAWMAWSVDVDGWAFARAVVPSPLEPSAALLAVGIVGATVMPHALHFHSAAARASARLDPDAAHRASRHTIRSVIGAMSVAAMANTGLIVFSADLPTGSGASIETAYAALAAHSGQITATMLGVALLASGLAATLVGVQTGDVVMQGFSSRQLSPIVRRLLAVVPALVMLAFGMDPTHALVLSQVALSFCLPGTLVPLVLFTSQRAVMGQLVNRVVTTAVAALITAVIVGLCGYLLLAG